MWGEVEVNPRILLQEFADRGGFVSREIVQDDVNVLVPGAEREDFLKEGDELPAGVASGGFCMKPSRGGGQGGQKGEGFRGERIPSPAVRNARGKGEKPNHP